MLTFLKAIVSSTGITKAAIVSLLLVTFSLGVLLALTIADRNLVKSNLVNATTQLKEKDSTIKEKDGEIQSLSKEFSGCRASIQSANEALEKAQAAAYQADQDRLAQAEKSLSGLSSQLIADRKVASDPGATNKWLQELLK